MGAEAYGLVGFYAMLQVWFNLLDMGLTPTMARETARFRGGATDALGYRRFVRALEVTFITVALIGGAAMCTASSYIASDWLKASQLPVIELQRAIQLIGVIIATRWMCGLYRGAISGSERLVWLGSYNAFVATLRFIGVVPILIFVGVTPVIFFSYQFLIAIVELTGLLIYVYCILPDIPLGRRLPWSWAPLKPVIKFSLTIAFTSSIWVIVTQTDKLVLSKILPLEEYGYFTLSVLVASGVMVISSPISGVIMPHMTRLEAKGDHAGLISVYRQATQLVAVIAGAVSVTLVLCAEPLLWAWTGDKNLALHAAPILRLYAIGNGILAIAAFPYYLQYAKGDLRLHLIGNAGFVVMLIPTIVWAASKYGGVGAGYVWMSANLLTFVAWLPLIHQKFAPGLNLKWYLQDVLVITAVAVIVGYCLSMFLTHSESRWLQLFQTIGLGSLVLVSAASASSAVRHRVKSKRLTRYLNRNHRL
jgi:O-antigen/teichoic acid export membrane protein